MPIERSFSAAFPNSWFIESRRFLSATKAFLICFLFVVLGPTVISPVILMFGSSKQKSISFLCWGVNPCFCTSPLVFTSNNMGVFLFKAFALELIFCASRVESTESIVSNSSRHLLIVLVWRCPIKRFVSEIGRASCRERV